MALFAGLQIERTQTEGQIATAASKGSDATVKDKGKQPSQRTEVRHRDRSSEKHPGKGQRSKQKNDSMDMEDDTEEIDTSDAEMLNLSDDDDRSDYEIYERAFHTLDDDLGAEEIDLVVLNEELSVR